MSFVPPLFAVLVACQVTLSAVDVESAPAVTENAAVVVQPPVPLAPRTEIPQTWLSPGYLWVPGHYDWSGKDYAWIAGVWQSAKVPAGTQLAWLEGRWFKDQAGTDQWNWVPAHFEPLDPNAVLPPQNAQAQAQVAPPTGVESGSGTTVVVEQSDPVYYDSTVVIGAPIWWGPAFSPYYGGGYYRGGYYGGVYYGSGFYGGGYYGNGYNRGGVFYRGSAYGGGGAYRGGGYVHSGTPASVPRENRSQR
jgi:hypothetical protein